MKTELTIEESAHLIELGVDAKLASKDRFNIEFYDGIKHNIPRPVFDLSDVMAILPKEIESKVTMFLSVCWGRKSKWTVCYDCVYSSSKKFTAPELIDALYQLLCWTLEQIPKTDKK